MAISEQIALAAAQNMLNNRYNIQIVTNNLANQSTAGFQADKAVFTSSSTGPNFAESLGATTDINTHRDVTAGEFQPTGNVLDVALGTADVYFSVQSDSGETLYTRNGHLQLNQDRQLIQSASGFPITDSNHSPITIPVGMNDIQITGDGTVSANGKIISKIGVFQFDNSQDLKKSGNTLMKASGDGTIATKYSVLQGGIEGSNVNPVFSISQLIELQRQDAQSAFIISTYKEQANQHIDNLLKPLNV